MLLPHVAHNRIIKVISGNLNRSINHSSAQRDNRHIRRTASDIYDHIAARSGNIDSSTDCSSHRFFDQSDFTSSCCIGRLFNCLTFYFCHSTRHTDTDSRLTESSPAHCFLHKIFDHLFCHCIIRNHALTQRTHCHNIPRRPAKHQSGFFSDCFDAVGIPVICYYGRLF